MPRAPKMVVEFDLIDCPTCGGAMLHHGAKKQRGSGGTNTFSNQNMTKVLWAIKREDWTVLEFFRSFFSRAQSLGFSHSNSVAHFLGGRSSVAPTCHLARGFSSCSTPSTNIQKAVSTLQLIL